MGTEKKLLAKKTLRAPFVTTVARVGAVLGSVACGGGTVAVDEGTLPETNPPPVGSCPAEVPSEGGACKPGTECGYDDCMGHPATTARCDEKGAWSILRMSCNPPPPPRCPEEQPATGGACDYVGAACEYGDCYGIPTVAATCVDKTWRVSEMTCNPPPPQTECPPEAPADASPCGAGELSCIYGTCDATATVATALCHEGAWQTGIATCNPPAPTCPTEAPTDGAACASPELECTYGDCSGVPTITAQCGADNLWSVVEMSCNPPQPPNE